MSAFYQTYYRCLIDARFGRIKQMYRLEDTDTVDHIASVVERFSTSNVPVLYGQWEWRAWKSYWATDLRRSLPSTATTTSALNRLIREQCTCGNLQSVQQKRGLSSVSRHCLKWTLKTSRASFHLPASGTSPISVQACATACENFF